MNNGGNMYVVKDFGGVSMRVYASPGETAEELERRAERLRQDEQVVAEMKIKSWLTESKQEYSRRYYHEHKEEMNAKNRENYRKRQQKVQQAKELEKRNRELEQIVKNRDAEIERLQAELQSMRDMLQSQKGPVEVQPAETLPVQQPVETLLTPVNIGTRTQTIPLRRMSRPEDLLKRS